MIFPDDWLHIKNWEKFQYRSDKRLPWIRLDCSLLQDRDFLKFDRATQRDLIAIWLLARNQSHAGWIPNDNHLVSKLIQGGRNLDLQVFVNSGFLEKKCALQDRTGQDKTEHPPNPLRGKAPKHPEPVFVLPDWVPKSEWDYFIEMRILKKKTPTGHARELLVKKLSELKAQGHDPAAVLEQSVVNGWQGLFPLNGNAKGFSKADERTAHNVRELQQFLANHREVAGDPGGELPPRGKGYPGGNLV